MRILITILLILSFGYTDGQQVINAHVRYRGFVSAAAQDLLLDSFPGAAAAYSLRKLDKDYTGPAIRVRKDTTGQPEQDIGFLPSGELDTVSLKSFLNQRSGFVAVWYNQADSSGVFGVRNATQATQANQPRIVDAGIIERRNGNIVIVNTDATDFFTTNRILTNGGNMSVFIVHHNIGGTSDLIGNRSASSGWIFGRSNVFFANVGRNQISTNVSGSLLSLSVLERNASNNLSYYRNGAETGARSGNVGYVSSNSFLQIGRGGDTGNSGTNNIYCEFIIYESSQSSNRTAIESNINSFYGIY